MLDRRVYGVIGVKSIMSNLNADFTGNPKRTSCGQIFGTDKSLKYGMKKKWHDDDKIVLYLKKLKKYVQKEGSKVLPTTMQESYEDLFNTELKVGEDIDILKNLFTAIDVKQFGATFAAIEKLNLGITGAVQIGQGFNLFEETNIEKMTIISPFRDGKKVGESKVDESKTAPLQTSLGKKTVTDEAHYFFPFSINPLVYKHYMNLGVTDGYTVDDYKEFKDVATICATYLDSNSKLGCENEFAIFVETKDDLYLPNLAQYIKVHKNDRKIKLILEFSELLDDLEDEILNIEIYYNPLYIDIDRNCLNNAKFFNIFTKKEIS